MANEFLVSVAKAIARDPNTGTGIFMGKTNISSAFTVSMTPTEVRGGINNPLLYVYYHDRKVEIKIEQATYDKTFLGLNVGQLSTSGAVTVLHTECVTFSSAGVATLSYTPLSDVVVFMDDGTIQNVTPIGSTATVTAAASKSLDVAYNRSVTADQITVSTITPPMVVDLSLIAEVRDSSGVITKYLNIEIPRFQISGNNTLSFAANGVSTQTLEGYALAVTASDCVTGDYYAKITEIPAASTAVAVSSIVALPSTLTFSVAAGLPASKTISVLAIKGTTNTSVTTSSSFTTTGSYYSVGLHTGIVTAGSSVYAGISGSVVVSYYDSVSGSTFTDSVNLLGIA